MGLADFIEENSWAIIDEAEAFAKTQLRDGAKLDSATLRDHLPQILKAIVQDLRTSQTAAQQQAKSEGQAPKTKGPESAATSHGRLRATNGFGVNQMAGEFRALRASVLRLWSADKELSVSSIEDMIRFNEAIDQALAESLTEFTREVQGWQNLFLGALGHDLRGPLSAITLSADMLVEQVQDAACQKHVNRIAVGAAHMHKLLDELLDYSKIQLGKGIIIERRPCDLRDAVEEELELLRAALPGIPIRLESSGPAPGRFDVVRVREAVHNLVTNAAKYGIEGKEVTVGLVVEPPYVRLSVSNYGAPLSEEQLNSMFDPLRRGTQKASTGERASLGIGLFIVREIVSAHGGAIRAFSEDGKTTFQATLSQHG